MLNILERSVYHMCGAWFLTTCFYFAFRYVQRKLRGNPKGQWFPAGTQPVMIMAALLTIIVSFWREPFDVFVGGWVWKSYIDGTVWSVFALISAYGIYRIKYKD